MVNYCSKCGTLKNEGDVFCSKCGEPIKDTSSSRLEQSCLHLPLLISGVLAFLSGIICMMLANTCDVNGFVRALDAHYDDLVQSAWDASTRSGVLIAIGIMLVVAGLILRKTLKVEPQNHSLKRWLWLVPLGIVFVFSLINYIPVIQLYLY